MQDKVLSIKEKFLSALKQPKQHKDILFAIGIMCIISVLIFPVPPLLLDFLLSISISFAVLILMTVLFINRSLDFNSFPSVLLVVTMLRLALNISTTRLILANGHLGTDAAGHVVQAFGHFVMEGSIVIGSIVFGILTIINFIVITKGSGRIAEVAARFSLDAMPGKQMSIDADLSAGIIKEDEAKKRRKDLEDESTFYGAMDGANKFVRGDAIAGLLITFINFIGGMLIGIVQKDMTFSQALHTYTLLTIGDGLVTQIPALIVSIAAGLLVTKSGAQGSTEKAIFEQLGNYPQSLAISAGLLLFMGVVMPGIPFIPFFIVALFCAAGAYFIHKNKISKDDKKSPDKPMTAEETKAAAERNIMQSLQIDMIKIELGYELIALLNGPEELRLPNQVKNLRKQIARDMGFILPSVRIQDNMELGNQEYVVRIKDVEVARNSVRPGKLLIMNPKGTSMTIEGEDVKDPAFGINARWIDPAFREEAMFKEYTVVEASTVIITHLTELVKENITELLTYGEVQKLIDNLSPEHKKLIETIIPSDMTLVTLQRVLQSLLSENVSVRDLSAIIEAVSEICANTKNISKLVEHVRMRLAKQICQANTSTKGYIPIVVLSPMWEQTFIENIVGEGDNKQLIMPPSKLHDFVISVSNEFDKQNANNEYPVLLTSPMLRPYARSIIERFKPNIVVMSQNEVHPKAKIKTVGQI
jgi:flagellar biosynthesis protein FlhA